MILGSETKSKVAFATDLKGNIASLSIQLEPSVKDIVFTRAADKGMMEKGFLEKFVGTYILSGAEVKVDLQGGEGPGLDRPGPAGIRARPLPGDRVQSQGLVDGYSVEFKLDAAGVVTEARLPSAQRDVHGEEESRGGRRYMKAIAHCFRHPGRPGLRSGPPQPSPRRDRARRWSRPPPRGSGCPVLTKSDVDGWLDGLMPYALSVGDIAGAVVTVVKDGQVLTERGFGLADVKSRRPVDPERTLFRPGSVSKLFTWTAVMQQVEAGKLDLDTDINTYLDFKIPPRDGKPITLRNLMTHTPGFGEAAQRPIRHLPRSGSGPWASTWRAWTPPRIFPPGEVPAYSNYGAGLAGYIVERVSGEPFDDYIETPHLRPARHDAGRASASPFRKP